MKLFKLLARYWWLILVAGILKWITFHVYILHNQLGQDYVLSIYDSLLTNGLLLLFTLSIININIRYVPAFGKFWFAMALSLALTWFWVWVSTEVMSELAGSDENFLRFLSYGYSIRWVIGFLVMSGASICGVFYYQSRENAAKLVREADTQSMVREAELQKLQLQLQPHFLFNSLNSVNAMILTKPNEAMGMIQRLSDFLRITTKRADEHWVKFLDEWEYLQLYLSIEKVRFGHRLDIKAEISEDVNEWKIPTLILQPLVENAIKFGLYGTTRQVDISFKAETENGMLRLTIDNPFEQDSLPQKGSGFGLNGLQRRLYLLYARNDLLRTRTEKNHFVVELTLPKQ